MLRGPWIPDLRSLALARPGHANSRVPGECSERSCASGTRPGTQRENREAQYFLTQQLVCDSPTLGGDLLVRRRPQSVSLAARNAIPACCSVYAAAGTNTNLSVRHSGRAAAAASAGIHNHRQWLWIPGSRASPAPRNDESEFTRVGLSTAGESQYDWRFS